MSDHLARYWWVLVLRGVLAAGFAFAAFHQPAADPEVIARAAGCYALISGPLAILSAFGSGACWGCILLPGIIDLTLGSLIFVRTDIMAYFLVDLITLWALAVGLLQIVLAVELQKEMPGARLLRVPGIVLLLLSASLLIRTVIRVPALPVCLGLFLLPYGVLLAIVGFWFWGSRPRHQSRVLA
jgi:uncharacterized membrane protein HdeD (DUF308 family)